MSSRISIEKPAFGGGRRSIPVVIVPGTLNRQQRRAQARQLKKITNQQKEKQHAHRHRRCLG